MPVAKELLDILVCPLCREGVEPDDVSSILICSMCSLAYPVGDAIPRMVPSDATPLPSPPPLEQDSN